jgi:Tfp pilus assembly protein PilF
MIKKSKKSGSKLLKRASLAGIFLMMMFSIMPIYAQQSNRMVTGTVINAAGETVVDASIVVKGSSLMTTSDVTGRFTIQTPSDATLVISFPGYQRREILVSNQTDIKVMLMEVGQEERWVSSKDKQMEQPNDEESKGGAISKIKSFFSRNDNNSVDNEERNAEAETYFEKGEKAYKDELYELAIEYYEKCTRLNPMHDLAHYWKGESYYDLKQYKKAIACYKHSLKYNPDDHMAYYSIGVCFYRLKEYKAGIEFVQKSIALDPNYKHSHNMMGHCYYALKNYKKALLCYQKALEIDPDDSSARKGIESCRRR